MKVFFNILLGLLIYAQAASAKKNICTITINSSHEKKVMEKYLPAQDFEFTELLPAPVKSASENTEINGIPSWLDNACTKNIDCDALVISGHFGGTFFGSSGYNLSLEQLERASCRPECAGIFKKPKETFLFGCNTLAGKTPDHRTPEEYLRVLLEDGMDRSDAEQTVALRYSPWGKENLQRMQGVFSGSAKIYGFDSVGPRGETIEAMFSRYFKEYGPGYSSYLEQLTRDSNPNMALKSALASTTFVEAVGIDQKSNPAICYLNDKKVPRISKVRFVESSLAGPNPLHYAPAIANWISELKDRNFSDEEWEMLDRVSWSRSLKSRFLTLACTIKKLPVLQASLWEFTMHMRWITESEFQAKLREAIIPYFSDKKISRAERDAVCSIANTNDRFRLKLTRQELGVTKLAPDMVTSLACLGNFDAELVAAAEKSIFSKAKDIRENGATALYVMNEISKFRGFSFRLLMKAAQKETDHDLKFFFQLLAGRAENGVDLKAYWKQAIEEMNRIDFSNRQAAQSWQLMTSYRKSPPELIDAILNWLEKVDESKIKETSVSYKVGYLQSALANENNNMTALADAVIARQENPNLPVTFQVFLKSSDDDDEKRRGIEFWSRVGDQAKNQIWRDLAETNLRKLRGLE